MSAHEQQRRDIQDFENIVNLDQYDVHRPNGVFFLNPTGQPPTPLNNTMCLAEQANVYTKRQMCVSYMYF